MKALIFIITALVSYVILSNTVLRRPDNSTKTPQAEMITARSKTKPIHVVFEQDVSESNQQSGVETISSNVFTPFFNATDHSIEIDVGCISSMSAGRLITAYLPAASFRHPSPPDVRNISLSEKKKLNDQYASELRIYHSDSLKFYTDRDSRVAHFCNEVDFLMNKYRRKLTSNTDLLTAIDIADKTFGFSADESTANYLILNSDGIDSYRHKINTMKNKATVILANAGRNGRTSVDAIVNQKLGSPEQAIQFILKHSSPLN